MRIFVVTALKIIIMRINIITIHDQYIENGTVIFAFHDTAKVQNGLVRAAFCGEAVFHVIVVTVSVGLDLIPDTSLDLRIIFRMHQIAEFTISELHKVIQVGTSREVDHFPVGEQNAFVCFVCLVNEKGTGQVTGDIIQFESQLCPFGSVEAALVAETAVLSAKLYFIECHVRVTQQIGNFLCVDRVLGITYGDAVVVCLPFAFKSPGGIAECLDSGSCFFHIAVLQDNAEFIAAVSPEDCILWKGLPHGIR